MIDRQRLMDQLVVHEGVVLHAYHDSEGYLTIGIGRLIDPRAGGKITMEEAVHLLTNDVNRTLKDAEKFPWFAGLDPVRQNAVVELLFNLGITKFKQFRRMIAAFAVGSYEKAAAELIDSKWAEQVGPIRSKRLMDMIRTGKWPI